MTFEAKVEATTGEWAEARKPIVVAVDGSERNRSAVQWAAHEAANTGCEVVLVTAVEDHVMAAPHFSARSQDQHAQDMLADVRHEIHHLVAEQQVHPRVVVGSPVDVLLQAGADARMVVVGKRGLGTFARVIVGSVSIAVAGRSKVPVTIVPDAWKQEDHESSPVVVGIDPYKANHTPIHLAFSRAKLSGVPLVAVHGWESPTIYSWDAATIAGTATEWEQEAQVAFEKLVSTWRERFPEVEVRAVHRRMHPAMAVLEEAEDAQLVVLGRHHDGRLGGFTFGSVTRAVLHYSGCPVLVVPAHEASEHRP